LFGKHVVIDGGPSGRILRILLARGLIGVVSTLAGISVILGEGRGIGMRQDLAQGGLRRFRLMWSVQLVKMLLYVLKDVVRTFVRRRGGLYPRRSEERFESCNTPD
jgi:hypothetical protein